MRFKLESAYFSPLNTNYWKEILEPFCEVEGNDLYLDIKYITELKNILDYIPEDLYEDGNGWKPKEVIINFENKIITLYDFYNK